MDRIFWELLKTLNGSNYIENIVLDNDNTFYFGALIPIMKLTEAFSTTFHHQEQDEDDIPVKQNQSRPITDYSQIIPDLDKNRSYRAVHPKYRMGDIILLKSKGNLSLTYYGNEGFRGQIYSNLGLFADF